MDNETALYNKIGVNYNTSRQADPKIAEILLELLAAKGDGVYADIGCGTGNYTSALADMGLNFYGVEPSETMLQVAKSKTEKINWLLGSAENIPLSDSSVDGAIATLTIHHWTDLEKAFREIRRTLKHDARMVIFTADPEQMKQYWLNHYFPKMMDAAIAQMPSFDHIKEAVTAAGMIIARTEKYFIGNDLQDLFLYAGKHKPEIYLKERVRQGISTFAALAHQDEVELGLEQLHNDISSGYFQSVKNQFTETQGDYQFIIVENL